MRRSSWKEDLHEKQEAPLRLEIFSARITPRLKKTKMPQPIYIHLVTIENTIQLILEKGTY